MDWRVVALRTLAGVCVAAAAGCLAYGELALASWNALNALGLKVELIRSRRPA